MSKRKNPEKSDSENPTWTVRDFERARRLPSLPAGLRTKLRGRPKLANAKVAISLRVDPSVLARWKASGTGWQTRMAQALAARAPRAE
jgi:uncharacterized protein (DUF4415 family)